MAAMCFPLVSDVLKLIWAQLSIKSLFALSRVSVRARRLVRLDPRIGSLDFSFLVDLRVTHDNLRLACEAGYLQIAKHLYLRLNGFASQRVLNDCFLTVCVKGDLPMAQWMSTFRPKKLPSVGIGWDRIDGLIVEPPRGSDVILKYVCAAGELEMAQWLLSINPLLNLQWAGSLALPEAHQNGHLPMIQWLAQHGVSLPSR